MSRKKYRVDVKLDDKHYVEAEFRIVKNRIGHRWIGHVARVHVTDAPIGRRPMDYDIPLNGNGASKAKSKVARDLLGKYKM